MGSRMINHYVGGQIEYLNAFIAHGVERLAGVVDRVGYVLTGRMPIGIDTSRKGGVGLGVEQFMFAVVLHQGSAMLSADMQT